MLNISKTILRYALGVMLAFVALNAFLGGYYAMSGADEVPTEWLRGSPFQDYSVPGLILFTIIGGVFLIAAIAVFAHLHIARVAAFSAVVIVLIWLGVQVAIIGYVSWMQPATAIVTIVILLMASLLPKSRPDRMKHKHSVRI